MGADIFELLYIRADKMDSVQAIEHIAINPEVRNGRAYIRGTTVTVSDVVIAMLYHQQNADGIAEWYGLSLPEVYAALSYYYENKEQLDGQIREQIRRAEALREQRAGGQDSLLS